MPRNPYQHGIFYVDTTTDDDGKEVEHCFVRLFDRDMRLQDERYPVSQIFPIQRPSNGTIVLCHENEGCFVVDFAEEFDGIPQTAPGSPTDAYLKWKRRFLESVGAYIPTEERNAIQTTGQGS